MPSINISIVEYNHKMVKTGRKLMSASIIILLVIALFLFLDENVIYFSKMFETKQLLIITSIFAILLLLSGSIIIGYYKSIPETIGVLRLNENEALIDYIDTSYLIHLNDYEIFFEIDGYYEQYPLNYNRRFSRGMIFDSGINKICFKNKSQTYEMELLIRSSKDMKTILSILKPYKLTLIH